MKKLKSIFVFLIVIIVTSLCMKTPVVFAAESKASLFSGSNSAGAWNLAVTLSSKKNGGTFDSSMFKDKGYFYVEYTGQQKGIQLILQSWSGGDGWTLVNPSETGMTEGHLNYAKFDEDSIKKVYKSDLSTVDAIHVWNTKGPITLKSIEYVSDDNKEDNKEDIKSDLKTVLPLEDNVRYLGRAYNYENELWLTPSASGAEFTFSGTEAQITFKGDFFADGANINNARAAVYVNDKLVVDKMITEPETTVKVFESKEPETVKITILKLSESANGTLGIKDIKINKEGTIKRTIKKSRSIEFIGDSITCGYGVDDEDKTHNFKTSTEDVSKTYAYKTAKALDAELNVTAYSGYGIVSGYGAPGVKNDKQILSKYYDKVGFSYGAFNSELKPDTIPWDFDKFQPDVVVINLGTNDSNYCNCDENKTEFIKGYVDFLKVVREKNPSAKILCTLGIMGDNLYDSLETAVDNYKGETEDLDVYAMRFAIQDYKDGYAADWHPTEKTHAKAAAKLTTKIKEIMNW